MYLNPMRTLVGTFLCGLCCILTTATFGCEKRCRPGSALVGGRCVLATSTDAVSGTTQDGGSGDSTLAGQEQADGSVSGASQTGVKSGDRSMEQSASAEVGAMSGSSEGSAGASSEDEAGGACQLSGTTRCGVDASGSPGIESCVGGLWTHAQSCAPEETCVADTSGTATCVPADSAQASCAGLMCADECVPSDEKNCGTCGHDCTQLAHVSGPATCNSGVCDFPESSCEPGFAHCSMSPDDGCETDLSSEKNCGGCANECPPTAPVCAMAGGSYECSTGCSAEAPELCGMSCIDVMTDAQHCGACDDACAAVSNGQAVCENGACTTKCNANHHLCGESCVSDRSTSSCGTSCDPCPTPTGAQATCNGGACDFTCTSSRALKCEDGCYPSDDRNCGTCGNDCASSGRLCDGTRCVECRTNNDCRGSNRYCVATQCRACQPGDASTCGDCQQCSLTGTCVSSGTQRSCYRDADGDGYGSARSSPMQVCGSCPSGYVENDEDCFDSGARAAEVHPGQTMYFDTSYGSGSYDYNCDGSEEPQVAGAREEVCRCVNTCQAEVVSTRVRCGEAPAQCLSVGQRCTDAEDCYTARGYAMSCR